MTLQRAASCNCAACAGASDSQYLGEAQPGLAATKPTLSLDEILSTLMRWDARWEAPMSIPFSFYEKVPAHLVDDPGYQKFVAFDAAQRDATRTALELISDVAKVAFVETPDDGSAPGENNPRLTYARADWGHANSTAGAWVDISETHLLGDAYEIFATQISFNTQRWAGPAAMGGREFYVILHETMHALGFPHPGDYNRGDAPEITYELHAEYAQDTGQYTVLSYFDEAHTGADHQGWFATTLLLHDVAALQLLYGANTETRATGTVYGFNSTAGRTAFDFTVNQHPVVTIWDAGGVDTLDLSGTAQSVNLDLNAGAFSDAFQMTKNISIAFGVVIENGRGGAASDVLRGNAEGNVLEGGGGADTFYGLGGDDLLNGGAGVDTAGYEGLRRAYTTATVDSVIGPDGADTMASIEVLSFLDGQLSFDLEGAAAAVYGLYDAAFDRLPDGWGFNAWLRQNQAGMSLDAMADAFAGSAEFAARYAGLSDRDFVEQMYRNALGREGETAGVDAWTSMLAQGGDRADVVRGFAGSAEHRGLLAPSVLQGLWIQDQDAVEIARLYDAAFGRRPDPGGATAWIREADAGMSLLGIAEGFTGSAEFAAIYGGLDDQGFLEQLYRVALDREADQGGLDAWLAYLAQGHSRAEVLVGFSESQENQISSQSYVDGGLWLA